MLGILEGARVSQKSVLLSFHLSISAIDRAAGISPESRTYRDLHCILGFYNVKTDRSLVECQSILGARGKALILCAAAPRLPLSRASARHKRRSRPRPAWCETLCWKTAASQKRNIVSRQKHHRGEAFSSPEAPFRNAAASSVSAGADFTMQPQHADWLRSTVASGVSQAWELHAFRCSVATG
jgi:hypothetical protein